MPVENAPKDGFALYIYNVNGNSNEVSLLPAGISVREGAIDDINMESIKKLVTGLNELKGENPGSSPVIQIPIYIINITNVLSNGNRNEAHINP